ncbi:MAG: hypothetical protein EP330_19465 [Deltaproteobacteria bacterium]|nr:MAG: hypothetical protein EP330_19465 [Deltaproteobacteria bacterium]
MRWLSLILLTACGTTAETWEAESITDGGTPCLTAQADGDGTITVDAGICLSSSCDRGETASCTAVLDGNTITVSSQFDWETATGNVDCTDDCGMLEATCTVGPLPAGEYTLVLGSGSETVTVPTEGSCGF